MARGRMLSKRISEDKQLIRIAREAGPWGMVFYTWMQPWLDVEGRLTGEPILLKAKVVPWHDECTTEVIEKTLAVAERLGHLRLYEVEGTRWLSWVNFREQQPGLRGDREAKSEIPAPPDAVRSSSGVLPELLRTNSGVAPEVVRGCSAASDSADFINPENGPVDNSSAERQKNPQQNVVDSESSENIELRSTAGAATEHCRKDSVSKFKIKVKCKDQNQVAEPPQPSAVRAATRRSPVVAANPSPSVCVIPLKGGHDHHVRAVDVAEWRVAFPAVDVSQELQHMRQWCLANPSRRKTVSGVRKFITSWLLRTQQQPKPTHLAKPRPQTKPTFADIVNATMEWANAEDEQERVRDVDGAPQGALPASGD